MKSYNYNQINNKNNFIQLKMDFKLLLFFILIMVSFTAIGQNANSVGKGKGNSDDNGIFKTISFGEKNDFGEVDSSAKWTIINTTDDTVVNLNGNQINDFIFEKPGTYELRFFGNDKRNDGGHKEDDNHSLFPEKIIIKVSSIKMIFDFSKIVFSEKIQKGKNCNNIVITVPVKISVKGNKGMKLKSPNLVIAGIGSELIAKPVQQEVVVSNGIQLLKYQLSGTVNKETYLMFDFFDFNNQVQTYNLLESIK
jgi:hypothetical protein